jgi:hypothetical protein
VDAGWNEGRQPTLCGQQSQQGPRGVRAHNPASHLAMARARQGRFTGSTRADDEEEGRAPFGRSHKASAQFEDAYDGERLRRRAAPTYANFLLFSAIQDASDPALVSTSIFSPSAKPFACSVNMFTKSYIDALSRKRQRKTRRAS